VGQRLVVLLWELLLRVPLLLLLLHPVALRMGRLPPGGLRWQPPKQTLRQ